MHARPNIIFPPSVLTDVQVSRWYLPATGPRSFPNFVMDEPVFLIFLFIAGGPVLHLDIGDDLYLYTTDCHFLILLCTFCAALYLSIALKGADGSAYLEMGQTKVIAIVKGPREVTRR